MRTISLDDWQLFSQRGNSSNYISEDGQWILKVPSQNAAELNDAIKESEITKIAMSHGIKTPAFKELVNLQDGSLAVINQYVKDKKSYARAMMEDRSLTDELMKNFAKEAKKFHSLDADKTIVTPFPKLIEKGLKHSEIFTEKEQDLLLNEIEKRNTAAKCLHGDFHPSNIIFNDSGSYFIDLGYFCYGNPLFDVGFYWFIVNYGVDVVFERVLHASKPEAIRQFEIFAKSYFDTNDYKNIEQELRPYGFLSSLLELISFPIDQAIIDTKDKIMEIAKGL